MEDRGDLCLRWVDSPNNQLSEERSGHRQSAIDECCSVERGVVQVTHVASVQDKQSRDRRPNKRRYEMPEHKVPRLGERRFDDAEE